MARWALIATTVGLLLAPAAAHAKCMRPGPFLSPASGAVLPPNPVIHLFVPGSLPPRAALPAVDIRVDGSPVPSTIELVSTAGAFVAYRVAVARETPGTLSMRIKPPQPFEVGLEARYTIGEPLPAVASPAGGTGAPVRKSMRWACSYQQSWNVTPAVDAPAYRVEWAFSQAGYEGGRRIFAVLPRNLDSFARGGDASAPLVELGAVNCLGTTVQWPLGSIWVGLWALRADGTEVPLTDEPLELTKP